MSNITVIGGIKGKLTVSTTEQLMAAQQNPAGISAAYTGTGRNIAENLGRMGADAALIAAVGNDFIGKAAIAELQQVGVDTEHIHLIDGQNTAMNIEILNIIDDLIFALDSREVYDCMTKELAAASVEALNSSRIVAADGSLTEEVLKYLAETVTVPLFFDPHTEEDAKKAKDFIGAFDMIKPDRAEASAICGKEIFSEEQLKEAGQWFADQGVKRIFITMSGGGVYYKEGPTEGILRPQQVLPFANEEGAGDAFSAALLDGAVKGMDVQQLAAYGMNAAAIAMECRSAVNPAMSRERLDEE